MPETHIIHLDSWAIRDMVYPDFHVWQVQVFAVELVVEQVRRAESRNLEWASSPEGEIVAVARVGTMRSEYAVLDAGGIRLFCRHPAVLLAGQGETLELRGHLVVDVGDYKNGWSRGPDSPRLMHAWTIQRIWRDDTPGIRRDTPWGTAFEPDLEHETWREVSRTDDLGDHGGWSTYRLECELRPDRLPVHPA